MLVCDGLTILPGRSAKTPYKVSREISIATQPFEPDEMITPLQRTGVDAVDRGRTGSVRSEKR